MSLFITMNGFAQVEDNEMLEKHRAFWQVPASLFFITAVKTRVSYHEIKSTNKLKRIRIVLRSSSHIKGSTMRLLPVSFS